MKKMFLLFFVFLSFASLAQEKKPKLVVGIVVDQMRYDYLYRFYDKYCDGGFKKLMQEGTNCKNTMYNYVPTFTGPGHASIYTGTTPSNHGIVGNDWYDRKTNKSINCVQDDSMFTVGDIDDEGKCSPHNLKVNTITDQLKLTYKDAKVISMSIKNRGAILPGGHLSDGSYWFDYSKGQFITSSFFKDALPAWVIDFNNQKQPDEYLTKTWETILPIEDYYESREDNSPYEYAIAGKATPTFPYNLKKLLKGKKDYGTFVYTPFANTYLTSFALEALDKEGLGKDGVTDMLTISYSTPDIIGHAFGPFSKEIEDCYLRLDLEIKRLIKELEAKVGKDNFTFFLTADHAVAPVPQFLVDNNLSGGYFYEDEFKLKLSDFSKKEFGEDLILTEQNNNIYLNRTRISDLKLNMNEVANKFAALIREQEGVKQVFTTKELLTLSKSDKLQEMIANGHHYKESGDLIYVLEANYLPKSNEENNSKKGTSHGSPYGYDTHVPLLWYGKHIPAQEVYDEVEIIDIVPTLVYLMDLQKPNGVTGKPVLEILK